MEAIELMGLDPGQGARHCTPFSRILPLLAGFSGIHLL